MICSKCFLYAAKLLQFTFESFTIMDFHFGKIYFDRSVGGLLR